MADILIRGMEMPKDCSFCKMAYDGSWCLLVEEANDCVEGGMMWRKCPYGGRPDWCPLVPLPEGHGRMGDLDSLFEKMYHLSDNEGAHKDSYVDDALILWDSACHLINDAPTIVPAEGGGEDG